MTKVVGVRFKKMGKVYYFDPQDLDLHEGLVVVETANGTECGELVFTEKEVPEDQLVAQLKKVIRQATPADEQRMAEREEKKADAMRICEEKVAAHQLEMKLIDVDIAFDGGKITFFFTADGRVDFRELVKDLAHVFRTRIELRQIGVRDETKMMGGIGACGRECCCSAFLNEFAPVSIKMAKEQSLSLNPTKISGLCGRLMCCLKYEQHYYEEMRREMPRVGKEIATPDGPGMLLENNVLKKTCRVRVTLPDQTMDIRNYSLEDIRRAEAGLPPLKAEPQREEEMMPEAIFVSDRKDEEPAKSENRQKRGEQQGRRRKPAQQQEKKPENKGENQNKGEQRNAKSRGQQRQGNKPEQSEQKGEGAKKPQGHRPQNSSRRGRRPQQGQKKPAQQQEAVTLRPAGEAPKNNQHKRNHRRRPRPQGNGGQETVRLVPATPKKGE